MPAVIVVAVIMLGVVGCETIQPTPKDPTQGVRITQLGKIEPAKSPRQSELNGLINVQAVAYPIDADLSEAWKLSEASLLDDETLALWRSNGLRIASVDTQRWQAFVNKLPPHLGAQKWTIAGTKDFEAIPIGPKIKQSTRAMVLLEPPPADSASNGSGDGTRNVAAVDGQASHAIDAGQAITFHRGRLQFLTRVFAGASGNEVTLDLVPHHHLVKASVRPRPREVELLDGIVFRDLLARVNMTAGSVLVVGIHRPAPAATLVKKPDGGDDIAPAGNGGADAASDPKSERDPTNPKPTEDTGNSSSDRPADSDATGGTPPKDTEEPPAKPDPKPLPNRLGELTLTASRTGRPVQLLMVLTVTPRAIYLQQQRARLNRSTAAQVRKTPPADPSTKPPASPDGR